MQRARWKLAIVGIVLMVLGAVNISVAQQPDNDESQPSENEESESATEDEEGFVPSETINVDSEISFPVDI